MSKPLISLDRFSDPEVMARLMECGAAPAPAQRGMLEGIELYVAGYGSIARPMCERLFDFGLRRFVLVDPKRYRPESVASQCEPADVGRSKVEVGAERLGQRGAQVRAFPADLHTCADGLLAPDGIVVVSADNRWADIGANRLAARMRGRLVKVNIEPRLSFIAVRCYDFRRDLEICCECQLSNNAAYQREVHPKSCDRPDEPTSLRPVPVGVGRRTASPRWLSEASGTVAALAVAQLADDRTAARWYSRQFDLVLPGGQPQWTRLTPSPDCRWDHRRRWPNLNRLTQSPRHIRLDDLLRLAHAPCDAATRLRFCQQVCTRASCDRCGRMLECIHWVREVGQQLRRCDCGGRVLPMAYWTYRQIRAEQLAGVLRVPLADWGVEPRAVIEISGPREPVAFVIGDERKGA